MIEQLKLEERDKLLLHSLNELTFTLPQSAIATHFAHVAGCLESEDLKNMPAEERRELLAKLNESLES